MHKERFDLIDEDALFWLAKTDAPENPGDFYGPYKKKIYREFYLEAPEFVFVRDIRRDLQERILSRIRRHTHTGRPN